MPESEGFANILRGELQEADGCARYVLTGDIDAASAPPLLTRLFDVAEAHGDVIELDMAEVGFLDSTGLQALVRLATALGDRGGRVRVVAPSAPVLRLLTITEIGGLFGLETEAEATGAS